MVKYVLLFFPFFSLLICMNYYQVKYVSPNFKSIAIYTLMVIPVLFVANVGINYYFNQGYSELNNIWRINIYIWTANFFNVVIMSYLWFGELPNLRTLLAGILVVIAIVLIS